MSGTITWVLTIVGPLALVLVPQWMTRNALAKRGIPQSLEPARNWLLKRIYSSRVTLPWKVEGDKEIELVNVVGTGIPEEIRQRNLQRIQAYQLFHGGKLMLPLIYRMGPTIILAFVFAIVNIVADPASMKTTGSGSVLALRTITNIGVSGVCLFVCMLVVFAYLRVVDILSRIES